MKLPEDKQLKTRLKALQSNFDVFAALASRMPLEADTRAMWLTLLDWWQRQDAWPVENFLLLSQEKKFQHVLSSAVAKIIDNAPAKYTQDVILLTVVDDRYVVLHSSPPFDMQALCYLKETPDDLITMQAVNLGMLAHHLSKISEKDTNGIPNNNDS